jgi:hypothetical protein
VCADSFVKHMKKFESELLRLNGRGE